MAMSVVMVTSSLPYPPESGAAIRIFQFARHLASRQDLTLVSYGRPADATAAAELRAMGLDVVVVPAPHRSHKRLQQLRTLGTNRSHLGAIFYTAAMQQAIAATVRDRSPDVLLVEGSLLMRHQFPGGVPLVLDEHNLEFEALERTAAVESSRLRRRFSRIEARKFKAEEGAAWHRADLCVFTSERELELVRRLSPQTRTACVPNGVDLDYFRPTDRRVDPRSLVFTGTLGYRPNTDAVHHLVVDILPRILRSAPETVLTIVGGGAPNDLARLAGPNVVFTGRVPDVRPYVEKAAVVVAPLRIGSGTRLKVLEAFAMAKATVSTTLGCEGIECESGEHLLVADGAEDFANSVLQLLADPARAAAMGARGRSLAERRYGWRALASRLEGALREVAAGRSRIHSPSLMSAG